MKGERVTRRARATMKKSESVDTKPPCVVIARRDARRERERATVRERRMRAIDGWVLIGEDLSESLKGKSGAGQFAHIFVPLISIPGSTS